MEVVDLRTLVPLDLATVLQSVRWQSRREFVSSGFVSVSARSVTNCARQPALNGKPYPKKTIIPGQVFTASNISKPGALKWELRPEFLK